MRRVFGLLALLGSGLVAAACGGQTIVRTVTVAKTQTTHASGEAGTGTASAAQAVAATSSPSSDGEQPRMATVGDSLTLRGNQSGEALRVTVDQVLDPLSVGPDDQADSGQRFVGVQLTLKNVGSVAYSDSPGNGSTLLSSTNEQASSEIVTGGPCGNGFQSSVKIPPGGEQQGCIPFELPSGEGAKLFQFTLDSGFANQTGQWSLAGADRSDQVPNTGGSTQPATQTISDAASPGGAEPAGAGPVHSLEAYWSRIASHDFRAAYVYFAPGALDSSEAEWIAGEKESRVESASFSGRVTAQSGGNATVAVQSLIIHDHQFGCRSWSGTYALVQIEGQWEIQRANITPESCN